MVKTAVKTDQKDKFVTQFADFKEKQNGTASDYISTLRSKAINHFQKLGFPTTKVERWKYTSLKPVLEVDFKSAYLYPETINLSDSDIEDPLKDEAAAKLVFVNGRFADGLSDTSALAENGITLMPLSQALKTQNELVEQYFGRWAKVDEEALTALNTAFATEGVYLNVPKNTILEKPLHFIFVSDGRDDSYICHPRNLFLCGESSAVKVVESHQALGDKPVFTNLVNEVKVEANGQFEHYRVQSGLRDHFHVSNTYVNEEKDSQVKTHVTTFDGRLVRNGLFVNVNGQNCDSSFEGLYVLENNTHVDNHTFVEHSKEQSQSNQLYKGVLSDESVGVFDGEIYVHKKAQQTNAFQLNQNVLLDDTATAHAKPQLEIFADDVKCSHGATTGTIDEEAIFYLQSRGINEKQARAMIMYAFANEVLERISIDSLRETLAGRLNDILTR